MIEPISMSIQYFLLRFGFRFYRGRHGLFDFIDDIIDKLDDETWFSITPSEIAKMHAKTICENPDILLILDSFCGVGGDILHFPKSTFLVGCDINRQRLETAIQLNKQHGNTRCDFVLTDSVRGVRSCFRPQSFDAVYLSPPWGHTGIRCRQVQPIFGSRKLSSLSVDGFSAFLRALRLTKNANVAYFLPRGMKESELTLLAEVSGDSRNFWVQVHESFDPDDETVSKKSKYKVRALTAYFGNLAQDKPA